MPARSGARTGTAGSDRTACGAPRDVRRPVPRGRRSSPRAHRRCSGRRAGRCNGPAVRAEGAQNHVSARRDTPRERRQVRALVLACDHEMERGTVVPEREPAPEVVATHVGEDPRDLLRPREVLPRPLQRGARDVDNRDIRVARHKSSAASRDAPPPTSTIGASSGMPSPSIIASDERGTGSHQLDPIPVVSFAAHVPSVPRVCASVGRRAADSRSRQERRHRTAPVRPAATVGQTDQCCRCLATGVVTCPLSEHPDIYYALTPALPV